MTQKIKTKHILKISFLKNSTIKKSLHNILKVVKNNQHFVLKNVSITKISNFFDFFGQKSKKNHHFLGAFIWNHPPVILVGARLF